MTEDRNLNALWLRCILEEILLSGARRAVISPGGRASTLCMAIAADPRFVDVIVATDERGGAFAALGMIKASGEPVVMVTTSGSAVANVVPALTEAHLCRLPLIVLTCDRPRRLRDTGFGQMIDHVGATRAFVVRHVDLDDPQASDAAVLALRTTVSELLPFVIDPALRGPVHLNIPLDGNEDPNEVSEGWQVPGLSAQAASGRLEAGARRPFVELAAPAPPPAHDMAALVRRLRTGPDVKGLIVAGPEGGIDPAQVARFAEQVGFPVLGEAVSGLRRPAVPGLVNAFDALAGEHGVRHAAPELVIRFGMAPVLPLLNDYLLAHPCPTVKVFDRAAERDFLHPSFELLVRPTVQVLDELAFAIGEGSREWQQQWTLAAQRGRAIREGVVAELPWGELPAADIIFAAPGFDFIHCANSMSIRHASIFYDAAKSSQAIHSCRGVNGIDGTLGTFVGELAASRANGLLVVGDKAFLHDLPSLSLRCRTPLRGTICVVDNGGGAIFDFLPASALPGYVDAVRNPTTMHVEAIAAAFDLPYVRCADPDTLRDTLRRRATAGDLAIVDVHVPAASLTEGMAALYRTINTNA